MPEYYKTNKGYCYKKTIETGSIRISINDYEKIMNTIYDEEGPSLIVVKCQAKATPLVFPHSFDGSVSINRFMSSIKS